MTYNPAPIEGGTTDEILQIDLGSLEISQLKLTPDFKDTYVGGAVMP